MKKSQNLMWIIPLTFKQKFLMSVKLKLVLSFLLFVQSFVSHAQDIKVPQGCDCEVIKDLKRKMNDSQSPYYFKRPQNYKPRTIFFPELDLSISHSGGASISNADYDLNFYEWTFVLNYKDSTKSKSFKTIFCDYEYEKFFSALGVLRKRDNNMFQAVSVGCKDTSANKLILLGMDSTNFTLYVGNKIVLASQNYKELRQFADFFRGLGKGDILTFKGDYYYIKSYKGTYYQAICNSVHHIESEQHSSTWLGKSRNTYSKARKDLRRHSHSKKMLFGTDVMYR